MNDLTRRQAIAALGSTAVFPWLPSCADTPAPLGSASEETVKALLDSCADNLLRLQPETATSLGVDKDERQALRSRLSDRSAAGQQVVAETLRDDLARASAVDTAALSRETRASLEVLKSAYRTALEGFDLPYGDVAVGGWRNTPYVVIQNVGAYLDIPRFLESEHLVANAADAEAWIARLEQYPAALDGELERMRAARAAGLVPPAFLIDKALAQLELAATRARAGDSLVESIAAKTTNIPGVWAEQARRIVTEHVAPPLERQIAELRQARALATDDAGMWARPQGEEYYRWALKASTTTSMTPDEVHQLGLDQVELLHGRIDPILRSLGYTEGSVGARMTELADDPRYQFPEGDEGRQEILAFIEERLSLIRARMPQAFGTLVRGNLEVRRLPPEEEPGAPGAYGGPGSIRRHDPWQILDQPAHHRPAQPLQPARPRPSRDDSRACVAGRVRAEAIADPVAPGVQRVLRRLGALCRTAGRRARRLRRLRRRTTRLSAVDCLPRLPARRRHRHSRQALDA